MRFCHFSTKPIRHLIALLLIASIAFSLMLSLPLASSASPPEPTYGTASVDGDTSEWNLNNDFFTNMYRAGDSTKPIESKAYLRYDCSTQTLYVLVLTEPNVHALTSAEDAWAAINLISNKTYNGNDNGGALPNFAWINSNGTHALGYEAAFKLSQGTFTIIIHIQVYDDDESQTSATDGFPQTGVPLVINCPVANPAIQVNKLISTDNASWNEADTPPGITVNAGTYVYYQFIVTNIGNVTLANITLTDSTYTLTNLNLPGTLAPNASYTYYLGPIQAQVGQHTNIATATGDYNNTTLDDTNPANYNATQPPPATPSINILKEISNDNNTWTDANTPPGLNATAGSIVYYRFTVLNNGDVTLENLTLSDNTYALTPLLPLSLAPNQTYTYYFGPVTAQIGQHTNIATATGDYNNTTVNDSDPANYYGVATDSGDICIKKYISTNRCTWYDANCQPGPTILAGKCIYYKIVIRNTGNVILSDITLEDSKLDITNITLPSTLQPRESFSVILGPFKAGLLWQTNNATATGTYQNTVYTDSDTANYYGTLRTYTACDYRGTGAASRLLSCNFKNTFSNGMEIGCYQNTDGYGYNWTSVTALKSFLRYTATSGPINCDKLNPTSLRTGGGTLAVQAAVLTLNIAFQGSSRSMPEGLGGGILYIKEGDSLSGKTMPQILAAANDALGGHELPEGYTYNSLKNLLENINEAFDDATPNSWAKTYLRIHIAG